MSTEVIILTTRASNFGSFPFIKTCIQILMKIEKTVSAMIFTLSEKSLKIERYRFQKPRHLHYQNVSFFIFQIRYNAIRPIIVNIWFISDSSRRPFRYLSCFKAISYDSYDISHNIGPIILPI